ncbi:MAG: hypothetical protein ACJA2G_000731, partial [Cognaticolwellia sp.]
MSIIKDIGCPDLSLLNRERYTDASQMQKYAGIAPVIESSGKKTWTHWRYSCP